MSFVSVPFAAFLATAVLGFSLCPARHRRRYLLAASFAFYCTYSLVHAGLLLGATALAQLCVRRMEGAPEETQRRYLYLAVGSLLLVLATFKYVPALGLPWGLALAIPAGISYYTFKLISHVIDAYWGKLDRRHDLLSLAGYAAFFPQIVSGPIQRSGDFFSQTEPERTVPAELRVSGLRLILFGCFKKLVVADRLGLLIDGVYAAPANHPDLVVALAAYLFPIQLYADFSGLTDMALGIGRLFGVNGPKNFDSPFYAATIQDFWRRWHMSLTEWLTTYLFTPLRMALRNHGQLGLIVSTAVTMGAIGIWHGPRWTYLAFGLLNALYVVVSLLTIKPRNRFWKGSRLVKLRRLWQPILVFQLTVFAFVFFRAPSLGEAGEILRRSVNGLWRLPSLVEGGAAAASLGSYWTRGDVLLLVVAIIVMEAVHWLQSRGRLAAVLGGLPGWVRWAGYYWLVGTTLLGATSSAGQFIYFKF